MLTAAPLPHLAVKPSPHPRLSFMQVKGLKVMSNLEGGMTPLLTPAEARDLGFHILTYPLSSLYAAHRCVPERCSCAKTASC
jgi:hypothetical protein